MNTKKAAPVCPPEAAHENADPTARLDRNRSLRNSTARRGAAGENIERQLAADLLNVLRSEAPGADPVVVGLALAAAGRQRGARP